MTDARFEWHRVNEEIADAEFSPDRFRSLADLRAFLTFGGHGEVKPQR